MADLVFTPTLFPPIGHTTAYHLRGGIVEFRCLMELRWNGGGAPSSELLQPDQHFTVLLWWSADGRGGWKPAAFRRRNGVEDRADIQVRPSSPVLLASILLNLPKDYYKDNANTRRYEEFTLRLPYHTTRPLQFCLKYRFGDGPWLWSGSRIGGVDGRVIVIPSQSPMPSGLSPNSGSPRPPLQFDDIFESHLEEGTKSLFKVTPADEGSSHEEIKLLDLLSLNVWRITSPISHIFGGSEHSPTQSDDRKQVADLPLGRVVLLERWMALVKIANPWMGPIHSASPAGGGGGGSSFTTKKECLLLLMQRKDAYHVAILPLSGIPSREGTPTVSSYITSSHASEQTPGSKEWDGVIWRIYDESPVDGGRLGHAECIVAVGMDVKSAVKGVISWASIAVKRASQPDTLLDTKKTGTHGSGEMGPFPGPPVSGDGAVHRPPTSHSLFHLHAGLSYCTWNSLGANLSGEKILQALQKIHEAGIKVCNVIIDDNWQTLENAKYTSSGTWSAFRANSNFDSVGGLSGLVERIRSQHCDIQNIGVWHALHGYWDGIAPGGEIDRTYKTVECTWRDNVNQQERNLRFVDPVDVERFYDDFYRYLSECGISCVKVDVQCRIDELKNGCDKGRLLPAYQRALALSARKYFQGRVIVCMAHVPQIIQNSLLGNGSIRPLFRTSDDFYPNVPESHGWHIFANSMNMTMFSHLNIVPDWDMFQTALPQYAGFHAAARCLSGGPVVITDVPGNHNVGLVQQMTATTANNYSITLRPSSMATPSDPYMSYTSSKLHRITNIFLRASSATNPEVASFMGFFNISMIPARDLFRLSDFDGLIEGFHYITRSYSSGYITPPVSQANADGTFMTLYLQPGEWDILTAVPVTRLLDSFSSATCYIGTFGLSTNMTGAAAVTNTSIRNVTGDNGLGCSVSIQYSVSALGTLLVYISNAIHNRLGVEVNGESQDRDEGNWRVHPDHEDIVEVFLGRAYEKLHRPAGQSGQVSHLAVEIILNGVSKEN